MTDEELTAPGRLEFPNRWVIDVHEVRDGKIYYQRWAPGTDEQGVFDECYRTDATDFVKQAREAGARRGEQ